MARARIQRDIIKVTDRTPAAPNASDLEQADEIIGKSCGEVVDYISGKETMVHWRVRKRLVENIAAALAAARQEERERSRVDSGA
jgi:hypothetical protein